MVIVSAKTNGMPEQTNKSKLLYINILSILIAF